MKSTMREKNSKVLTSAEYCFLESKNREGIYNQSTREKLYRIIKKLKDGKQNCSRAEKKLSKFFQDANFGIHLDTQTRENITHSGKVKVSAKFEGEIIAQAVLIEKTASVAANIAAEVVMCKGEVFGDIRATHKIKIAKDAKVNGDIHSPNFIIEKGAVFDGRCSMPNLKKPSLLHQLGAVLKKTA
jgi:cytoskeletal protein CcmA (bactofilin family)